VASRAAAERGRHDIDRARKAAFARNLVAETIPTPICRAARPERPQCEGEGGEHSVEQREREVARMQARGASGSGRMLPKSPTMRNGRAAPTMRPSNPPSNARMPAFYEVDRETTFAAGCAERFFIVAMTSRFAVQDGLSPRSPTPTARRSAMP